MCVVLCERARATGGNRKGNTFATLLLATLSATSCHDGGSGDDGNSVEYIFADKILPNKIGRFGGKIKRWWC